MKNIKEKELFTCHSCQKEWNNEFLRLVNQQNQKICRNCTLIMLSKANQISGQKIVLKKKLVEKPQTFVCQTCQQTHQGDPHQVHITNYQGIIPQNLTSVCSPCLEDKVTIADFYCPRTSEGRDTYNPSEPQFDCWCPINNL